MTPEATITALVLAIWASIMMLVVLWRCTRLARKLDTVERHTLAMDARITEIELDLETRP